MISVTASTVTPRLVNSQYGETQKSSVSQATAAAPAAANDVSISTLASRSAAAAAGSSYDGLPHDALAVRVRANTEKILYVLDDAHLKAAAAEIPQPPDADAQRSADAATEFVNSRRASANPFAGLSREQLATIANDESGTFTINERRAAWDQAYKEEEAWREQVVAKAMQEYHQTGKLTNFFKDVLAHFETLPALEQSQYPANYASDLTAKIKLDFNYFNHTAGDGPPTPGSLATLASWN